jgi:hypothetical protein
MMGESNLIWSPIHLRLSNQHTIILVRRSARVSVNIDGGRIIPDFKVIEIIDGSTCYLALLGLD